MENNIIETTKKSQSDFGVLRNESIISDIREFVENECRKPSSKYGYMPFIEHFVPVVKYAKMLAEKLNADSEIVEISAWLHDIGSIIYGRDNHHITSSEIAETKLLEIGYSREKIERVKHCIIAHRGSKSIKRETLEAQILADADSLSHFDDVNVLIGAYMEHENKDLKTAKKAVLEKLNNSFNKLSPEAKIIFKSNYENAIGLLN